MSSSPVIVEGDDGNDSSEEASAALGGCLTFSTRPQQLRQSHLVRALEAVESRCLRLVV